MEKSNKIPKYPQNLPLKGQVVENRITIQNLAKEIGICRKVVSDTLNGHYKGVNIIPLIEKALEDHKNSQITH